MSYAGYVIAAYAAFAIVMVWDALVPRWQIARALRAARRRARRDAARRGTASAAGDAMPPAAATTAAASTTTPVTTSEPDSTDSHR